ncbi:hypothetical protein [Streptomyces sp. NPDC059819]|uniref:hypothetical protein n=1 Tax=Streptomyces sp. NPDC059819 TaxID=3346963 RepID=UPI00364EFA39
MRRTLFVPMVTAAVAAVVLAGCGSGSTPPTGTGSASVSQAPAPAASEPNPAGDIPDNQVYVLYAPGGSNGAFTVKVPEGWARTDSAGTVSFTDKLNRIEIVPRSGAAAPTSQSVSAQVVPGLRQHVPKFAMGKVGVVSRQAGPVVLLTYQGDTAPDPVTGKVVHDAFERYAFHSGSREVDLTLSGPVGADNVDPWRIVTDSFRWQ